MGQTLLGKELLSEKHFATKKSHAFIDSMEFYKDNCAFL